MILQPSFLTHTHTHTRARARTHTHTHTHTHIYICVCACVSSGLFSNCWFVITNSNMLFLICLRTLSVAQTKTLHRKMRWSAYSELKCVEEEDRDLFWFDFSVFEEARTNTDHYSIVHFIQPWGEGRRLFQIWNICAFLDFTYLIAFNAISFYNFVLLFHQLHPFLLPIVAFHVVIALIFACIRQYVSSAELVLGNHMMVKLMVFTVHHWSPFWTRQINQLLNGRPTEI